MATTILCGSQLSALLCSVLSRNDISFERHGSLAVSSTINTASGDIRLLLRIHPSKMRINLYAPIGRPACSDRTAELSYALCRINHALPDGAFCYDFQGGMVYFRMAASFYNSEPAEGSLEYMLSFAADTVEEYRPRLERLLAA